MARFLLFPILAALLLTMTPALAEPARDDLVEVSLATADGETYYVSACRLTVDKVASGEVDVLDDRECFESGIWKESNDQTGLQTRAGRTDAGQLYSSDNPVLP